MASTKENSRETLAPPEAGEEKVAAGGGELSYEELLALYDESLRNLAEGEVVRGKVIGITGSSVVVDVGYKSEGLIAVEEFQDHQGNVTVEVGDEIDVLLESTEDQEGHVLLSKTKADRLKVWEEIETAYRESRPIAGRVIDRIKGGLTVDVGVRAFLPGSLADIKPIKHLESLKGKELDFKVISLDRRRNNIVLSRKAVLEKELEAKKAETVERLEEGVRLPGVVKNITDYGVFIDLGGIDGLLHITDISWGRVNHPSEHFGVGEEVDVVVLKFDPDTERVSLGYKQKSEDPWTLVDKKYPVGARVRGKVVSIVDYGAFVELEEGVEGLIHVSEMSWTKKVINPAKVVNIDDEVEAIVSELDMDQRRISLSLRQTERNPWEELSDLHPVGSVVEGRVRNITDFGAFVEITEGIDGLIHVSDMSWTKRVKHPSEVLKKGDLVKARISSIDVPNQRVSLSIKEFLHDEWDSFVEKFRVGDTLEGKVVNVTDFGLFIDIYNGLEGLAHVSEIDLAAGESLEEHYRTGDWVRARILRIEDADRKVGLTMRGVAQPTPEEISELEQKLVERRPPPPPEAVAERAVPAPAADTGGFTTMGKALEALGAVRGAREQAPEEGEGEAAKTAEEPEAEARAEPEEVEAEAQPEEAVASEEASAAEVAQAAATPAEAEQEAAAVEEAAASEEAQVAPEPEEATAEEKPAKVRKSAKAAKAEEEGTTAKAKKPAAKAKKAPAAKGAKSAKGKASKATEKAKAEEQSGTSE
jgi:small subunit ribosomal protein S1